MSDNTIVAEGLLRCTRWFGRQGLWDCGMAFTVGPTFIEAYAVRASMLAGRLLRLNRAQDVAHSFCKKTLTFQGVAEENMYGMGYAYNRDSQGMPNCSCVADASSSAFALIETIKAYPDAPYTAGYIASLRRFIDYVLERYATKDGVIGVGILSHKVNKWPEYWCANALFAPVLIGFAEVTGETRYADAAVVPLEWLSRYDYRHSPDRTWDLSAVEVIMYAGEGILYGLNSKLMQSRLACAPVLPAGPGLAPVQSLADVQAPNRVVFETNADTSNHASKATVRDGLVNRWQEFARWLLSHDNAQGAWFYSTSPDYHSYEAGLSWTINSALHAVGANPDWEVMIDRQLRYMGTPEGKSYFGLYCEVFGTALAFLSFASVAEDLMKRDPDGFHQALADVQTRLQNNLW